MKRFLRDTSGNFGVIAAALAIPLIGAIAGAVDITSIYRERSAVQDALDAALLAAGKETGLNDEQRRRLAEQILRSNLKMMRTREPSLSVRIVSGAATMEGTVTAVYKTSFMGVVGVPSMALTVESAVGAGTSGYMDVALVLDATGSLGSDGVNAVRRAAGSFKDAIFSSAADPSYVQLAVVPFAATVNVGRGFPMAMMDRNADGRYHAFSLEGRQVGNIRATCENVNWGGGGATDPGGGRTESNLIDPKGHQWLNLAFGTLRGMNPVSAAQASQDPAANGLTGGYRIIGAGNGCDQVYNPEKINNFDLFDRIPNVTWAGCVEARPEPFDTSDATPLAANADTLFVPYFWPDETDEYEDWVPRHTNNYLADIQSPPVWTPSDWLDPQYWGRGYILSKYDGVQNAVFGGLNAMTGGPNRGCPSPIQPLTNSDAALTNAIADYDKVDGGGTLISEGVAWGMRVLSPAQPFTQTKSGDDVRRMMVVMSDGENQTSINPKTANAVSGHDHRGSPFVSDYSAYGYVRFGRLSPDDRISTFEDKLNVKTEEACDAAKDQDIEVFTILFKSTSTAARQTLTSCATKPENFFLARDADELEAVFSAIASDYGAYRLTR
jgi:Flp pilus assembly protein TadG